MTQNWKTVVSLGTAVAILLGIIYIKTGPKTAIYTAPQNSYSNPSQSTPPATDNPNDMQSALLQSAVQEQSSFSAEAGDSAAVSSDNQAISNFGQAYDANAF
jgi:hypothetical protein